MQSLLRLKQRVCINPLRNLAGTNTSFESFFKHSNFSFAMKEKLPDQYKKLPITKKMQRVNKITLTRPKNWMIFKNDTVAVVYGPCRGQTGKVLKVLRSKRQLIIEGVNGHKVKVPTNTYTDQYADIYRADIKPIQVFRPVRLDNCKLFDVVNNAVARAKWRVNNLGQRERYFEYNDQVIPRLDTHKTYLERAAKRPDGPKDTPSNLVLTKTFQGNDYIDIAKTFLAKIKEIKQVEKNLRLNDKKLKF